MIRKPLFLLFTIVLLISACTKIQSTDIGSGLIPPIDGVITKDTILDVITQTYLETDSARVYKDDDHVIGVINNDPLFGKTRASAFFELKPSFYKYFFTGIKDSIVTDSAVLILGYKGAWGDTLATQTWRVFEINKTNPLKYDSAYPANIAQINYGNQLGVLNNLSIPNLDDSVKNRFENAKNQIRIKLEKSFAERLLKQYDSVPGSINGAYANDSAFRSFFAGFAVVPDEGSGNALIRINLLDTNTKLALYYSTRGQGTTSRDTTVSYFRFITSAGTQTSGNANIIKRERTGSELMAHINTRPNDSLVYVQTSPGTFINVKTPQLVGFPNSLIHRAELIAEQVPHSVLLDERLSPPRYLLLSIFDTTKKSKVNVPNDYQIDLSSGVSNIGVFGGFLSYKNIAGVRSAYYDFNLTRYVQGIVTRDDKVYDLRISAPSNDSLIYTDPYPSTLTSTTYLQPSTANIIANGRVRLGGGEGDKNRPYRMRLRIIYSRL